MISTKCERCAKLKREDLCNLLGDYYSFEANIRRILAEPQSGGKKPLEQVKEAVYWLTKTTEAYEEETSEQ